MAYNSSYDVIIIGGSYSGLAAAMALGRALKKVLIIDEGKPCNRQTPYSHNFITHDGKTPAAIATLAKEQVKLYDTVAFFKGRATTGKANQNGFEIEVSSGEIFEAKKIIFASGIRDILPDIEGLAASWGISVLHCPYCHGYEVRDEKTGILGNADLAFDLTRLISNWTNDLTVFTNGTSAFTTEQKEQLEKRHIAIVETAIEKLEHNNGYVQKIIFVDGSTFSIKALYAPVPFEQHCAIPALLGCQLTDDGYIKVDPFMETTVPGVFACGDNAAIMRTVANAVAMGTTAGMVASKKMILEAF
jgi:thioredoxin reductase